MVDEQQLLQKHARTWAGFCKLLTWSSIGIAITLVLMWIFLV